MSMKTKILRRCECDTIEVSTPSAGVALIAPYPVADRSSGVFPEDLIVAEILPRLPVKSLFKFKCVSTRYNSIVSHPKLARNYLQLAFSSPESFSSSGLLGLLLFPFQGPYLAPTMVKDLTHTLNSITGQYCDDDQLPIPVSYVSLPDDDAYDEDDRHHIVASSNGLVLSYDCTSSVAVSNRRCYYYVSNPLTKQCVELPKSSFTKCSTEYHIATRHDHAAAFLTYKVVFIHMFFENVGPCDAKTSAGIFSSDTGSWANWEVGNCPREGLYLDGSGFAYKGIIHWLNQKKDTVLTYDPFDNPDRLGCIRLPNGKNPHSSLIYSGDQEMLKYCEIHKGGPGVDMLFVWRLVDSDKGEWCLEGKYGVPSLPYSCNLLMVAPIPFNRDIICHPVVMGHEFTIINPWSGTWKSVDLYPEDDPPADFAIEHVSYLNPLIPIELCPWSSPFYVQAS